MRTRILGCCLGALAFVAACGGSTTTPAPGTDAATLSAAYAVATDSSGTLVCAPSGNQIAACAGLPAGAACTLAATDASAARAGICRTGVDRTTVACAPDPLVLPQPLVDACAGLTTGDACEVTEAFGNTRDGTCVVAPETGTLICGRPQQPCDACIAACADLALGDSCVLPGRRENGPDEGVCALGPAGTEPLACVPVHELLPRWVEACAGLDAGAACGMGARDDRLNGTCVVPAAAGEAICVVQCEHLGNEFQCGPGPSAGPGPDAGPGHGNP